MLALHGKVRFVIHTYINGENLLRGSRFTPEKLVTFYFWLQGHMGCIQKDILIQY